MTPLDLAAANLLSPIVLCFALGALSVAVRSDFRMPEALFDGLIVYLMLAIGLKGGVQLGEAGLARIAPFAAVAVVLSVAIPLWSFALLRGAMGFSVPDAAALAAHYGSVSAVTFIAVLSFLDGAGIGYEGFAAALLAIMEAPGIVVAILLARVAGRDAETQGLGRLLAAVGSGKSMFLLIGGLCIGWVVGDDGFAPVKPVFVGLFPGALCLFLLELGRLAALRAHELRHVGARVAIFAIGAPVVHGLLGVALGKAAGLSLGGTVVLATLAASASYIAAPAAVRIALPQANPAIYLTASLAITFPFNLALGIPFFVAAARWAIS
ncbi:MAG: sodium-dependent bicarbonate transport family permease [Rhodospirillaceae bacterium]|nr:sodium-dependent bicarbonate transport family permease [Rhodospirillaceae bacterium]